MLGQRYVAANWRRPYVRTLAENIAVAIKELALSGTTGMPNYHSELFVHYSYDLLDDPVLPYCLSVLILKLTRLGYAGAWLPPTYSYLHSLTALIDTLMDVWAQIIPPALTHPAVRNLWQCVFRVSDNSESERLVLNMLAALQKQSERNDGKI